MFYARLGLLAVGRVGVPPCAVHLLVGLATSRALSRRGVCDVGGVSLATRTCSSLTASLTASWSAGRCAARGRPCRGQRSSRLRLSARPGQRRRPRCTARRPHRRRQGDAGTAPHTLVTLRLLRPLLLTAYSLDPETPPVRVRRPETVSLPLLTLALLCRRVVGAIAHTTDCVHPPPPASPRPSSLPAPVPT
jgi:hypothetical protein